MVSLGLAAERATSPAKRKDAAYRKHISRLSSQVRANIPGFRFPVLMASIGADRADLRAGRGSAKFAEKRRLPEQRIAEDEIRAPVSMLHY